jgi:SAM-dependent methyltransferase
MSGHASVEQYLLPGEYIDSDDERVRRFAREACGDATSDVDRAVRLYYAVRDGIVYTPYCDFRSPETFRASACLARGSGFCVAKAALLAAAARASGVPARIGFADVRNHLTSPRLRALMGTDVFFYHGYAELYLEGRWVKATPAFDQALCGRFGVRPLAFDGHADSLFQPYDAKGRRHMEYVRDRGPAADVPASTIMETFERCYPRLATERPAPSDTQFRREAEEAAGPVRDDQPTAPVAPEPAPTSGGSRDRWNRRWAGDRPHATTAPSQFLVAEVGDLPAGTGLDLACGAGRNAVWLAERGWRMTAVDFSATALGMARELAAERGAPVEWVEADVVIWTPSARAYDLVCVMYLQLPAHERKIVLARAARAVRPGGTLLVVGHDLLNLTEGWGGPTSPDVLFTPDDVAAEIGDLEVLKAQRLRRTVEDNGTRHEAVDALVLARRPRPQT